MAEPKDQDLFVNGDPGLRTCVSSRVMIVDQTGRLLLVRHKQTDWWGLPGGKVQTAEGLKGENLLADGAQPTVAREVSEECGLDITGSALVCLGLAEIGIVDGLARMVTLALTPIFACRLDRCLEEWTRDVRLVEALGHIHGPVFPDVRMGQVRLREVVAARSRPVHPEFLNRGAVCYFMMKPHMGLLTGPPTWLTHK